MLANGGEHKHPRTQRFAAVASRGKQTRSVAPESHPGGRRSRPVTGPSGEADGLSECSPHPAGDARWSLTSPAAPERPSHAWPRIAECVETARAFRSLQGARKASRRCASRAPVTTEASGLLGMPRDFHGLSAAVQLPCIAAWTRASLAGARLFSGGGGIRTLERPVTSNGFRDRYELAGLQGF